MAAINEVTGDTIITPSTSQDYRDNYDRIFKKPKEEVINDEDGKVINPGDGESKKPTQT